MFYQHFQKLAYIFKDLYLQTLIGNQSFLVHVRSWQSDCLEMVSLFSDGYLDPVSQSVSVQCQQVSVGAEFWSFDCVRSQTSLVVARATCSQLRVRPASPLRRSLSAGAGTPVLRTATVRTTAMLTVPVRSCNCLSHFPGPEWHTICKTSHHGSWSWFCFKMILSSYILSLFIVIWKK